MSHSNKKSINFPIVIFSLIISLIFFRYHKYTVSEGYTVSSNSPIGIKAPSSGKVEELKLGYPLVYKHKTVYRPNDAKKAGYSSYSNEVEGFSKTNVILNFIFWYSLIFTLHALYIERKKK